MANWLSYSDADGNPATKYQFWDGGTNANSGYFSTPGNAHRPAGIAVEIAAANLSKVKVHGGAAVMSASDPKRTSNLYGRHAALTGVKADFMLLAAGAR